MQILGRSPIGGSWRGLLSCRGKSAYPPDSFLGFSNQIH